MFTKKLFSVIKKIKKDQQGLSLIEVLIALMIFVMITFILASFFSGSIKSQKYTLEQTEVTDQARKAVEKMVKEMRESINGADGSYPIVSIAKNEIIFFADYDQDIVTERIRYWLEDTTFYKGVTEPSGNPVTYNSADEEITTVSDYIRNEEDEPIFSYKNNLYQDINLPANPDQVRLIHFMIKINISETGSPSDYLLESDVTIRNFKKDV